MEEKITMLVEELTKLNKKVDEFIDSQKNFCEKYDSIIERLEAKINEQARRIDELEQKLAALENFIASAAMEADDEEPVASPTQKPSEQIMSNFNDAFSFFDKMASSGMAPNEFIGSHYKQPEPKQQSLDDQIEQMKASGIGERMNSVNMDSMNMFNNFFNKNNPSASIPTTQPTQSFNQYNHYEMPDTPVYHTVPPTNNDPRTFKPTNSWDQYNITVNNNIPSATNPCSKKYRFALAEDESYFTITSTIDGNVVRIYKGSIGFDMMFKRLVKENIHTYNLTDADIDEYRETLNKIINNGTDPTIPKSWNVNRYTQNYTQPTPQPAPSPAQYNQYPSTSVMGMTYELKPFMNNNNDQSRRNMGMYY